MSDIRNYRVILIMPSGELKDTDIVIGGDGWNESIAMQHAIKYVGVLEIKEVKR